MGLNVPEATGSPSARARSGGAAGSGGAKRTRALWGVPTGGDAIAEGPTRTDGRLPWEELPEGRQSFSSPVP